MPGVLPAPVFANPRSPEWPRVRAAHLKLHPICACCGSKEHLDVHHRRPVHLFPALELAESNLITLCMGPIPCHWLVGHAATSWLCYVPDPAAAAKRLGKLLASLRKGSKR